MFLFNSYLICDGSRSTKRTKSSWETVKHISITKVSKNFTLDKLHFIACSSTLQNFSSCGAEIKMLLASQKRDGFLVGLCPIETLIEYIIHSNETSFTSFSRKNETSFTSFSRNNNQYNGCISLHPFHDWTYYHSGRGTTFQHNTMLLHQLIFTFGSFVTKCFFTTLIRSSKNDFN